MGKVVWEKVAFFSFCSLLIKASHAPMIKIIFIIDHDYMTFQEWKLNLSWSWTNNAEHKTWRSVCKNMTRLLPNLVIPSELSQSDYSNYCWARLPMILHQVWWKLIRLQIKLRCEGVGFVCTSVADIVRGPFKTKIAPSSAMSTAQTSQVIKVQRIMGDLK